MDVSFRSRLHAFQKSSALRAKDLLLGQGVYAGASTHCERMVGRRADAQFLGPGKISVGALSGRCPKLDDYATIADTEVLALCKVSRKRFLRFGAPAHSLGTTNFD